MLQGVRRHLFPQQEIPAKASVRQQRVSARCTVQVSAYSAGGLFVEFPQRVMLDLIKSGDSEGWIESG